MDCMDNIDSMDSIDSIDIAWIAWIASKYDLNVIRWVYRKGDKIIIMRD